MRYRIRVPPPEGFAARLECSTDGGASWQPFANAEIPADNEFSSGWLAGEADMGSTQAREALVRVVLDSQGTQTGVISAQLYGVSRSTPPNGLTLTHGWNENGASREHTEMIPEGRREHSYHVPTGESVADSFVRMSVP